MYFSIKEESNVKKRVHFQLIKCENKIPNYSFMNTNNTMHSKRKKKWIKNHLFTRRRKRDFRCAVEAADASPGLTRSDSAAYRRPLPKLMSEFITINGTAEFGGGFEGNDIGSGDSSHGSSEESGRRMRSEGQCSQKWNSKPKKALCFLVL